MGEVEEEEELWETLSRLQSSFKLKLVKGRKLMILRPIHPQKSLLLMIATKTLMSEKGKVTWTEDILNESENIHSHVN